MRKQIAFILILISIIALLSACSCEHQWSNATCELPATCTKCGEIDGSPLGHAWERPTCTQAAFCPQCGASQGEAAGHDWEDANCITAKTCTICNEAEGDPLGHNWQDATCTTAKSCSICGEHEGSPIPHTINEWSETVTPTCKEVGSQEGFCSMCGSTITETLEKIPHTPGDWVIIEPATSDSKGTRANYCTVCQIELKSESFDLSKEEKIALFKKECKTYSFNEIARNPDQYKFEKVKFTGTVIQSMENGQKYTLRVKLGNYKNVIYVQYTKQSSSEPRILEDDKITMYGIFAGTITYETVMGASVTIPAMIANYIDFS